MYIGVAVRGAVLALGFVYNDGKLTFPSFFPLDPENDANDIILDLVFTIKTIAETVPFELFNDQLEGIGVTVLGQLDQKNEKIVECENRGLMKINLRERLQRNFEIDVWVDSADAAMQAAAKEIEGFDEQSAAIIAAGLLGRRAYEG